MTFDALADTLRDMYVTGKGRREATVALALFGIRYASEIRAVEAGAVASAVDNLLQNAHISASHEVSIRLGMQLAAYVEYRGDAYAK